MNGVAHSSSWGETRYTSRALAPPIISHSAWRCQMSAATVRTSVWPAEYSTARPISASAPEVTRSGLSSSGDRIGGYRRGRGVRKDQLWRWGGVVRQVQLEIRDAVRAGAGEVVGDHLGH